jgi:hypothetical protein
MNFLYELRAPHNCELTRLVKRFLHFTTDNQTFDRFKQNLKSSS